MGPTRVQRLGGPSGFRPIDATQQCSGRLAETGDLWVVELERSVPSPFVVDAANDGSPVWSPDSGRIAFNSTRTGHNDLYVKSFPGGSTEMLLLESSDNKVPIDWSADGKFVLYNSLSQKTGFDLWVVPLAGNGQPFPVTQFPSIEDAGRFSPDSQWITYQSTATGRNEIFVKRLLDTSLGKQVSTGGGTDPRWPSDGGEILYTAPDNRVMAVPVTLPAEGTKAQPGIPVPLFMLPAGAAYDVTSDGQRFLANVPTAEAAIHPITVVVNWRRGK